MPGKILIIDGSSLVYRAFYALPLLETATGLYTNAVYGFTTMLVKLMGEMKPAGIAVAFDKGKITFRNEAYAQYKAHRKPTPPELAEQFPLIHQVLAAWGIAVLEEAGFEADDIIGTLAKQCGEKGHQVIIVTGDRDALQLINAQTTVLLTRKGISDMELFNEETLMAKYGVTPRQIIDLKGLMGDTSDNIPGVPGVGEKTAAKLVAEFGSVETVLANIDKVAGKKLQENLRNNSQLAILSKKLATIECNMPLALPEEEYVPSPNGAMLRELFSQFEFKSLLSKVDSLFLGQKASSPLADDQLTAACQVTGLAEAQTLVSQIRQAGRLVCYPLTQGQVPQVVFQGLGLFSNNQGYFISADSSGWSAMAALLADEKIAKITCDAKQLSAACLQAGISLQALAFDVLLAAYLLDPTASGYTLIDLAQKYGDQPLLVCGKEGQGQPDFAAWGSGMVALLEPILQKLLKEKGLDELYHSIELPLVEVLAVMEFTGIKVDAAKLDQMSAEIGAKIHRLLADIYELAGEEFNVNSTKQLGVILFEKLQLPVQRKTKTGYSTDAEVLETLAGAHPVIDHLLEYRLLTKLKSTYLDSMRELINPTTGRVHTTFNQMVTATGRLSSSEPNLQNIPVRTEAGRKIRELFIPDKGFALLMTADYSQIELRVLAHMADDANLIQAFLDNKDIHTATAAEVFGLEEDQVSSQLRFRAKAVNFGIVYGISDYGLSKDIGVSRKEAGTYIESYFARYQGVKHYIEAMIAEAHRDGYVTTLFGRRRNLPEIHSSNFNQRSFAERTAMNTPIQGTAADIIKKAMIDVFRQLKASGLQSRILLQVHDELVLEVVTGEEDQVGNIVKQAMEGAGRLSVPLTIDIKTGKNWAQAK